MKLLNRYLLVNFYILPLLITIMLVFGYWDALLELYGRLNSEERYSHGFMIPFVVIYLIYQRIELIKSKGIQFSWMGVFFVLIAALVYFVGYLSALWTVVQYSLFLMLVGVVLSLIGWQATRVIVVPLSLLLLSIPLPYFIDIVLSGKMQLLSSSLGVKFIRYCNIPVFLEGNIIDLGVYKLQVVEACSGLRYLYPLMSVGLVFAYTYNESFWKKWVVFLSTIPLTILMNSFRIGVVGVLVEKYGVEMAEGFLHDFEGWIIFMVCFCVLLIEMRFMSKLPLSQVFTLDIEVNDTTRREPFFDRPTNHYSLPLIISASAIFVVVSLVSIFGKNIEYIPDRKTFASFSNNLDSYSEGKRKYFKKSEQSILNVTDYLLMDYEIGNKKVSLYVGYHESQRTGSAPHSPRACIPGGGWEISSIDRIKLSDGGSNEMFFDSNRLVVKKGKQTMLVYYWFQQRGHIFANEYLMKWHLFKDGIVSNRSDGALVRLTTNIYPYEDINKADQRLKQISASLMPLLTEYIPE